MMINKFEIPHRKLAAFCNRWKIIELALFGSVLREAFGPESDVDMLATFEPDHGWSLLDHVAMEEELKEIFMRHVDLVNRQAIEQSHNHIRRKEILGSAEVIHVVSR
ncbi:MAG: nucleotidyltransferase domain-containing protein [Candidatus Marinimicrobia bacterium]|nr:nucleotidyltransferase domain-containing protein [Candidatus Neomarinimicrobiota bacterium]